MNQMFAFCFELDSVGHITPWGVGDDRKLHWFGLTSGRYWIATPVGEALRYSESACRRWNLTSPYVDYQVAKFFEDLQHQLPYALERVPADMAAMASDHGWYRMAKMWKDANPEKRSDIWLNGLEWWHQRGFGTAYLVGGPFFYVWRVEDRIFFRWEPKTSGGEQIWLAPRGEFALPVSEFETACNTFFKEFIRQMQDRVDRINSAGWNRSDCFLDLELLTLEQGIRRELLSGLEGRKPNTDWTSARTRFKELCLCIADQKPEA